MDAVLIPGEDAPNAEVIFPEHLSQLAQSVKRQLYVRDAGLGTDSPFNAVAVAERVVQGGRIHMELTGENGRIAHHADRFQIGLYVVESGAHGGVVEVRGTDARTESGGGLRDQDRYVPHDPRLTGQPPSRGIVLLGDMTGDGRVRFAGKDLHPALSAGSVAGTGRVDVDARAACDIHQAFA